jgi:hypothetical protein
MKNCNWRMVKAMAGLNTGAAGKESRCRAYPWQDIWRRALSRTTA